MTPEELDRKLRTLTAHEELYRQGWVNPEVQDMNTTVVNGQPIPFFRLDGKMPLMSGGKHARFNNYPAHIHPWVELNYMYSGCCEQIVNGRHITTIAILRNSKKLTTMVEWHRGERDAT